LPESLLLPREAQLSNPGIQNTENIEENSSTLAEFGLSRERERDRDKMHCSRTIINNSNSLIITL
jgi:hypothetical protein